VNLSHIPKFNILWYDIGFKLEHMNDLDLDPQLHSARHIGIFIIRWLTTILDRINVVLIPRVISSPREAPILFGSAFAVQSPLQDLANIRKDMTL
jgi:hypothetical protein